MTARPSATARWLVMACVAVPVARSAPAEQIPSHWIPVERALLNAEVKLANKGKTMVKGIIKCHRKVVSEAAKGRACNEAQLNLCLTNVRTKWLNQTRGLVHNDADDQNAVILQNALVLAGGAEGAFEHIEFGLRRATGRIYCCGTAPLGCNFSGRAPDPGSDPNCTFKNLDKLSKAVGKYAQDLLKCQIDLMKKTFKGEAFSLEGCETAAATKFDGKVATVTALPLCVQTASALFGKGARSVQDDAKAELPSTQRKYASEAAPPSGTPGAARPLDARGCCQGATSCADVASKESCTCPPQASCPAADPTCCFYHAVECNAAGQCVPLTCTQTGDPQTDTCDQGETVQNCPDCKCGNGVCDGTAAYPPETCATCKKDCGECTAPPTPVPGSGKRVFVTSTDIAANFGGIAGANSICQNAATVAGLTGTFKAWVGDSVSGPATNFTHPTVPYYKFDGVSSVTVANGWADLTDGTLAAPIDRDEYGVQWTPYGVWTSVNPDGTPCGSNHCFDWTTTSVAVGGRQGVTSETSSFWTVNSGFGCMFDAPACNTTLTRVYCFEQ
jgi:hypothetical protein